MPWVGLCSSQIRWEEERQRLVRLTLNNVCIVVMSALSCTPGWAMLKLAVANVHVTKMG